MDTKANTHELPGKGGAIQQARERPSELQPQRPSPEKHIAGVESKEIKHPSELEQQIAPNFLELPASTASPSASNQNSALASELASAASVSLSTSHPWVPDDTPKAVGSTSRLEILKERIDNVRGEKREIVKDARVGSTGGGVEERDHGRTEETHLIGLSISYSRRFRYLKSTRM